jgi:hypothetical protein
MRLTKIVGVVAGTLVIAACAGKPAALDLSTSANLQCKANAGVSLMDSTLTIGAGSKPTPGYNVQLEEQIDDDGHIKLTYDVSSPRTGVILPQMITTPCLYVTLPDDWERLSVINKESGQSWVFDRP